MRSLSFSLALVCLLTVLSSCDDSSQKSGKEARDAADDFFSGEDADVSLNSLKNELAGAHTDFVRSFSDDALPWQKWDPSILAKAKSAQTPIFALVGSSLGGASRSVAKEISENEELRNFFANQSVCTVIDIHAHPEIGMLCFHLASEAKRATAFPMFVWLSHEGSPITSYPVGSLSGRSLKNLINSAIAMVDDIWTRHSEYAVENSRADNAARQRRLNLAMNELEEIEERDEVFRIGTRRLSTFYSSVDQDLDYIGGLIPTNSLELLAIGSHSNRLTGAVRKQCREAAHVIANDLIKGALKDHFSGSYFYARRTTDWSLPNFSQNLISQARLAHMLIRVGTLLDEKNLTQEGLHILTIVEKDWLAKSLSSLSPLGDPDEPGKFLWDFETLKKVLTDEEISLAGAAFSLRKNGNIPAVIDPLGNYYQLNSIRREVPLSQLAADRNVSQEALADSLKVVTDKLLAHRNKSTEFITETALTLSDHAVFLKAQVARANLTGLAEDLATAQNAGKSLLKEYQHPEKGFARLSLKRGFVPARCEDYANASHALFLLYQATLAEEWLTASQKTLDLAMTNLISKIGLLTEAPAEGKIIPLDQFGRAMVFGESSLGLLDQALIRHFALTGDEKYGAMLAQNLQSLAPLAKRSPVTHTDFLASCVLGEEPLLAVLRGDPNSPQAQKLLRLLNSQKYLPYLTIRPAGKSDLLSPLPELPEGENVVLIRDGKKLGHASDPSNLELLLQKIISQN